MRFSYSLHTIGIAGVLALLAGCDMTSYTEVGALGNTTFSYQCVAETDPQCDLRVAPAPGTAGFPVIAVGSRFSIQSGSKQQVYPASDGIILDEETGYLAAVSTGWSTVVSKSGAASTRLEDLIYVNVAAPTRIRVFLDLSTKFGSLPVDILDAEDSISGNLVVKEASSTKFRAFVVDDANQMLAGAFPITWAMDNSESLQLEESAHLTTKNTVEVQARSAGITTMTVRIGALKTSFSVEVRS